MLSVKNLTKIYKTKGGEETKALDGVNIDFPETGMVFLLGKSGSGKSTLLNLIGGLDSPSSGEVILKGRSSKNFNQSDFDSYRNTYIGFVFQEYYILNEFNVEQNIALAMELQNRKVDKEEIDKLLNQVDLGRFAKRKPNTLSGGQKQRIAIARALIKSPKIILADEPTGALDSTTGKQVFDTLKKLSENKLILVVSHDRDFAEIYGDRIIELKDGKVISDETKFYKKQNKISENISIINSHAIKINNAKDLSKEEFDKLYEEIKNSEGEVFISSGENAQKSMRASRISATGDSEDFKATEKIELKQYDGKDTKFIRSKMPLGKAIKMGLSSLKTKPIRLLVTILLAVTSFTMFGVISSLMLYNSAYTYSEAIKKTDYIAEKLEKYSTGINYSRNYRYGELDSEYHYDQTKKELFGKSEIEALNEENQDMHFIGIFDAGFGLSSDNIQILNYADYYSCFDITNVSDCGEEELSKMGYTITGTYPEKSDEIVLPMEYYYLIRDNIEVPSINQAIGKIIKLNTNSGRREFKITGFAAIDPIPEEYSVLKNDRNISAADKTILIKKFKAYIQNSFNSIAFVSPYFISTVDIDSSSYYIEPYSRSGIVIETQKITYDVDDNSWSSFYTDRIYQNNKGEFSFYDLDGNEINNMTLKADEVIISDDTYKNLQGDVAQRISSRINDAINIKDYLYSSSSYLDANNEKITQIFNHLYDWEYRGQIIQNVEYLKTVLNTIKTDFNKAKKLFDYIYSFSYNTSDEELNAIFSDLSSRALVSEENFNKAYNYMLLHYDTSNPNGVLIKLFDELINYSSDELENVYQTNQIIADLKNNRNYINLSKEQVDEMKDFVNTYYSKYTYSMISGVTFAELDYVPDFIYYITQKLYYKNYRGVQGELNIKGYYKSSSSYSYFVNADFIDSISLAPEYSYENEYVTDYIKPTDAKYNMIMSKTNYSLEQIEVMRSTRTGYYYILTNDVFQASNMIAELVSNLKKIFFWVGIVLGVFSSLMLLNFITISISSKKKDIGILRAIGARKIDVFKIFYSESLFIGLICFLLAVIATAVVEIILNNTFIEEIGITILSFGLINIGMILSISLLVTFVATILPVMHSSKKPPVEAIRAL